MPIADSKWPHFGVEGELRASEAHFDGKQSLIFTPNIGVDNVINSMLAVASPPYLAIAWFDSR
jgi:hypothetical protein